MLLFKTGFGIASFDKKLFVLFVNETNGYRKLNDLSNQKCFFFAIDEFISGSICKTILFKSHETQHLSKS